MSKLTIARTDAAMPSGTALDGVRSFLFGVLDGFGQDDKKAWRRFWKRVTQAEPGEMFNLEAVFPRNPKFHRKMFALLTVGFDCWEPDRKKFAYAGRPIEKNFERFREQVLILAGHYDQVFSLRGDKMELVAKSISYASMDDSEFSELYESVLTVILNNVCVNYKNRDELNSVVEKVLGFSS